MNIWVLVFLMAQGPGENFTEFYKLDTEFVSKEECVAYVSNPLTNRIIKDHIKSVYPIRPVQGVWCVTVDKWEELSQPFPTI